MRSNVSVALSGPTEVASRWVKGSDRLSSEPSPTRALGTRNWHKASTASATRFRSAAERADRQCACNNNQSWPLCGELCRHECIGMGPNLAPASSRGQKTLRMRNAKAISKACRVRVVEASETGATPASILALAAAAMGPGHTMATARERTVLKDPRFLRRAASNVQSINWLAGCLRARWWRHPGPLPWKYRVGPGAGPKCENSWRTSANEPQPTRWTARSAAGRHSACLAYGRSPGAASH